MSSLIVDSDLDPIITKLLETRSDIDRMAAIQKLKAEKLMEEQEETLQMLDELIKRSLDLENVIGALED